MIDRALPIKARLGESPVWSPLDQRLYWVDIEGHRLHRFRPSDGANESIDVGQEIGCVALKRDGGIVAGMRKGVYAIDVWGEAPRLLLAPEADKPDNRFNDGSVDPRGRFWAGTMKMVGEPEAAGSFYRFDSHTECVQMLRGFFTTNGLAFSPDGRTLYCSDSYRSVRTIWAFDYDLDDGAISYRRVFFDTNSVAGRPDGGAVDVEGCYWMAGVGGWQVLRITPDGKVDRIIDMPVERPTKLAFGGADLRTAFVTSTLDGITPGTEARQPQAGSLFAFDAGVEGLPQSYLAESW